MVAIPFIQRIIIAVIIALNKKFTSWCMLHSTYREMTHGIELRNKVNQTSGPTSEFPY